MELYLTWQGQSAREKPYSLIKYAHAHYLESMANCVDTSSWVPVKKLLISEANAKRRKMLLPRVLGAIQMCKAIHRTI